MARVPAVPNISKDTAAPDERNIDVDAGVLDVDAEVPDDYNWDDLPDDDDELIPNSDEDPHQLEPPQPPESRNQKPQTLQPSTRTSPPRDSSLPNGHASPPRHGPHAARGPYASKSPPEQRNPRPDGVVADPMGVDRMEEGEIEQRWYKKKKKKKPVVVLRCEICNISVTGEVTMQSHLKGQKHKTNERQAAITERNKKHVEHEKANISRNEPPHNPQQPGNDRNSSNIPPQRSPAGPSNSQRPSGRAEQMPKQRDPYMQRDVGRPAEPPRDPRQAAPDDARKTSYDPIVKSGVPDADRKEMLEKEKGVSDARNAIDPYANRVLYPPKDPYATKDSNKPNLYSNSKGDPFAIRDHKKSKDSSGAKAAESNVISLPKDPLPQQNGGKETQGDSDEGRKRKHLEDGSNRSHAHVERNSPDKAPDRAHYESTGDGTGRRKLDDNMRDPRKRDSNANSDAPQPRPPVGPSESAPSKEQPGPPLQTPESMAPRPLQFFSVPAPPPAGPRTERRDNRRPPDTRRFTYGPGEREKSVAIPLEWMSQPMDTSEWRDLRTGVFERGTDVDQLAYKMLQEILLSPVLGVSGKSLAPFSRAMLNAVKDQRISSDEAYVKFADFPESLSVRDENYAKGDPEWQKSQTPEELALKLVSENILFCLNPYEDNEAVETTELHNIPRRGSFGQKNMVKSSRDGGMSPRYQDSVEQDKLFNELYEHLLYRNMSR